MRVNPGRTTVEIDLRANEVFIDISTSEAIEAITEDADIPSVLDCFEEDALKDYCSDRYPEWFQKTE